MDNKDVRELAFGIVLLFAAFVGFVYGAEKTHPLSVLEGRVCSHDIITVGDQPAELVFDNPTEYFSSNGAGKAIGTQVFEPNTRIRLSVNGCWNVISGSVMAESTSMLQLANIAIYLFLGLLAGVIIGAVISGTIKLIGWAMK